MTDEIYKCGNCGCDDGTGLFDIKITGLTQAQLDEIEGIIDSDDVDKPEIEVIDEHCRCDGCGEIDTQVLVYSTEWEYEREIQ